MYIKSFKSCSNVKEHNDQKRAKNLRIEKVIFVQHKTVEAFYSMAPLLSRFLFENDFQKFQPNYFVDGVDLAVLAWASLRPTREGMTSFLHTKGAGAIKLVFSRTFRHLGIQQTFP
jgi:hypothetical protein